jgi:hypothetical protein
VVGTESRLVDDISRLERPDLLLKAYEIHVARYHDGCSGGDVNRFAPRVEVSNERKNAIDLSLPPAVVVATRKMHVNQEEIRRKTGIGQLGEDAQIPVNGSCLR